MNVSCKIVKKGILVTMIMILFAGALSTESASAQKVLVNIWDGAEWSKIQSLFHAGSLPNLERVGPGPLFQLTCNIAYFSGCGCEECDMRSTTKPQNATMLTGVLADVHGVYSNSCYQLIPDGLTVYEQIEDADNSIQTAHISSKPENFGEPTFGNIASDVDYFVADSMAPNAAATHAIDLINAWHDQDFFIVCHFKKPDSTGHTFGIGSKEYKKAIRACDRQLGKLLDALDARGIRGQTKVYVLSDHGFGTPDPLGHIYAPNTFFVSNDSGIAQDLYMLDIANILLGNFGLSP